MIFSRFLLLSDKTLRISLFSKQQRFAEAVQSSKRVRDQNIFAVVVVVADVVVAVLVVVVVADVVVVVVADVVVVAAVIVVVLKFYRPIFCDQKTPHFDRLVMQLHKQC